MTVKKAAEQLQFRILADVQEDCPVKGVYTCDLLSFAMGRAPEGFAWVTVMGNVNTVAVASLTDVACVVLAESVTPDSEMLEKAKKQGIWILQSDLPIYETAKAIDHILC